MNKKLIILTIPGIGTQKVGYSNDFHDDLLKHTKGSELEGNIRVLETFPFSETQIDKNQNAMYERLDAPNKLGGILTPRRFTMSAFGDGVTFERDASAPDSNYKKVHRYLRKSIREANELLKSFDSGKLIIVTSSMGAHLLSTYIWDADYGKGIFADSPATADEDLHNLVHLSSVGCNIPLFVSGLPESQIVAFDKTKRAAGFTWDNYYDRNDVLGWPLKQLSVSYENVVTDYEINTGLYLGSHTRYWDDNDFTKPFTDKLKELF